MTATNLSKGLPAKFPYINWQQLVKELRDSGMTDEDIAGEVGFAQRTTIWRIANRAGACPQHARHANALINLHIERCPELEFPRA